MNNLHPLYMPYGCAHTSIYFKIFTARRKYASVL
ncbi:hypothetical protein AZE42_06530 [Rhizopogon vesiculosus]|uniref:Uncharacterized protein n=1 Tax=Rhizopogon vesiculosus TaxID=180088 RepID=A0A1J8PWZ6_9AGAM|nr:hypothetical protein AZE42_06530 [Rhizopogon vesiculosus]